MTSPAETVTRCLEALRAGDFESALCDLIEAGAQVLPHLVIAYAQERSPHIRAALVRLIWEQRKPQSVAFLAKAFDDRSSEVRKAALDGLVTLGGSAASEALRGALSATDPRAEWAEWLREAIAQVSSET